MSVPADDHSVCSASLAGAILIHQAVLPLEMSPLLARFLTLLWVLLVVNALMLMLAAGIVSGFRIKSFGSAFLAALLLGVMNWGVGAIFG